MARKRGPGWFASNDTRKWLGGLTRFAAGLDDQPVTRRAFGLAALAMARMAGALPDDEALGPHVARVLRDASAGVPADMNAISLLKEDEGAVEALGGIAALLTNFSVFLEHLWQPEIGDTYYENSAATIASFASGLRPDQQEGACEALRCVFGAVVRPPSIDPLWLTANESAVARLAQDVEANQRFDVMPVMGDALEEGGCTDEALLRHCRSAGPHAPGCWVVAAILGGRQWDEARRFGVAVGYLSLRLYCNGEDQYALGQRGFAYSRIGRYDELIDDLNLLLALRPTDFWALQTRGYGYQQKGQNELALADFTRAIELAPNDAWSHAHLGYSLNNLGLYDRALVSLGRAIQLNPLYGWAWGKRGYARLMKGEWAAATEDFTHALEHCPDYANEPDRPWAYASLGWAGNNLGQFDRALEALGRAIELRPNYGWAWGKFGYARLRKGDHAGAIEAFTHALERCPDFITQSDRPWAQATRGYVYLLANQPANGIADFTQAIECPAFATNSALPWALNELAWALATWPDDAVRDGKRAVELANRACELSAWKDADHLDTLAAAHAEAGDFAEAVRLQEQAVGMGTLDGEARVRLGLYREGRPYRRPA